jgi:tetratricopeptide (TPR) repeat protein
MPSPKEYTKVTDHITQGKYKAAMQALMPLLEKEPKNVGLLLDAGFISANLDKFEDSIQYYETVIELTPSNPAGYTGLGFVYKLQGNDKKRLEMFQKGIRNSPANAMIHFEIGEALLDLDQYKPALVSFQKAIQFGGLETEAETLVRIAQVQLGLDRPDKTIEISNNILKKYPDYVEIHYVMAGAEALNGNYASAVKHLEKYLEFAPDDHDAKEMLKKIKNEMKKE